MPHLERVHAAGQCARRRAREKARVADCGGRSHRGLRLRNSHGLVVIVGFVGRALPGSRAFHNGVYGAPHPRDVPVRPSISRRRPQPGAPPLVAGASEATRQAPGLRARRRSVRNRARNDWSKRSRYQAAPAGCSSRLYGPATAGITTRTRLRQRPPAAWNRILDGERDGRTRARWWRGH